MFGRTIPTKDVKLTKLFPDYRKRQVSLRQGTSVSLNGLNWDGGSRSEYTLVDLTTRQMTRIGNNIAAPWNNKDEGSRVTPANAVAFFKKSLLFILLDVDVKNGFKLKLDYEAVMLRGAQLPFCQTGNLSAEVLMIFNFPIQQISTLFLIFFY